MHFSPFEIPFVLKARYSEDTTLLTLEPSEVATKYIGVPSDKPIELRILQVVRLPTQEPIDPRWFSFEACGKNDGDEREATLRFAGAAFSAEHAERPSESSRLLYDTILNETQLELLVEGFPSSENRYEQLTNLIVNVRFRSLCD